MVAMCGRYASTRDPATLAAEFDAVDATGDEAPGADYNIAPTKPVFAVVARHPRDADGTPDPYRTERSVRVMRWGLVPHWAKDPSIGSRMINARAESAAGKPAFRTALASRRCLLPADGWFEWQQHAQQQSQPRAARKQPYFLTPADGSVVALAGLWATWRPADSDDPPLVSCAVITAEAVGPLAQIHDRMPLVLPAEGWADWLDPDSRDPGSLLAPPPAAVVDGFELRRISTAVNDVRHNGPELLEPEHPDQPALIELDS